MDKTLTMEVSNPDADGFLWKPQISLSIPTIKYYCT